MMPSLQHAKAAGLRQALLGGASLAALSVGLSMPTAHAAAPLSPAWFQQRSNQVMSGSSAAGTAFTSNGLGSSPQSVQQAQKSIADLTKAAQAIVAAQQRQAQVAANAVPSGILNGLGSGGLLPVAGAMPGSAAWMGANLPTQSASGGRTTVTVQQTSPQATLTWQSFNVGQQTTLAFNQSAGGSLASTWVVVNRWSIPTPRRAKSLGRSLRRAKSTSSTGTGSSSGAGSQVNVGSLVASTADIDPTQFQTTGIFSQQSGATLVPSFTGASATSSIEVEPGATITTNPAASSTQTGGFVLLMGGQVENDGTIVTPNGQAVMAAGSNFVLQPGFSVPSGTNSAVTGNSTSTVRGIEIAVSGTGGSVTNTGLLEATTGDVTLVGHDVLQAGVAVSTTSVAQRGTIHLLTDTTDQTASVTLAPAA